MRVGSVVRAMLHNRRIRGWVIDDDATPPEGVRLLELTKWSGCGPNEEIIELASWAAWRWAGKRSFFLQTASPLRNVRSLGRDTHAPAVDSEWFSGSSTTVLRWPPATDPLPLALAADDRGPALIVSPSQRGAEKLARRMREAGRRVALYPDQWALAAGGGVSVVGTRASAWAPMVDLNSVLVLDAHDEALQSEASPTWSAIDVVVERARRREIPCVLSSFAPRVELLHERKLIEPDRAVEREGWAALHVVDLRKSDPHSGLYSPRVVELLRSTKRVVCILNRKGRAQLLVCKACDEIARCEKCSGSLTNSSKDDDRNDLVCKRCAARQPVVCGTCGSTVFKQLRAGVSRVREELESLALRPVGEVTGESDTLPDASVLVGTEAVLHRIGRADAVVFLDFDQELLAPRFRATEDALILLARASKLVGGRRSGGLIVVQTRQPKHEAITAAENADPTRVSVIEAERRAELQWPPFSRLAIVEGGGASDFVAALSGDFDVLEPREGSYLLKAATADVLANAFSGVKRPARLRIEIDPPRI